MSNSDFSNDALEQRVKSGDTRAIARLITLAENRIPRALDVQAKLYAGSTGRARVIGVTGPPGAGKSTLIDQFAKELIATNQRVAIVAVDPSSPFSGGAVLGDRIRMNFASVEEKIFIRSMATRGALGGLSRATVDAVQILDAGGFDTIIIETVGVGQAEVDIARLAQTCIVVAVPASGDSVQAFKAGVLEIADIFVVNKSDRDGADLTERDLLTLLALDKSEAGGWKRPIVRTTATTGAGIAALVSETHRHGEWLASSAAGERKRQLITTHTILRLAQEMLFAEALERDPGPLQTLVEQCLQRKIDPYQAAKLLLERLSK